MIKQIHLFLVRHGDREDYDIKRGAQWKATAARIKMQRVKDPPVSSLGHSQARDVAVELQSRRDSLGLTSTVILSSPYLRCIQTATPTAELLDMDINLENGLAECHFGTNYVKSAEERWSNFPRVNIEYKSMYEPRANDDTSPPFKPEFGIKTCESFPRGYMERILEFGAVLTEFAVKNVKPGEMMVGFSHAASVALVGALTKSATVDWTMAPTGIFHLTLAPGATTWSLVDEENAGKNTHCSKTSAGTFAWGFSRVEGAAEVWTELTAATSGEAKSNSGSSSGGGSSGDSSGDTISVLSLGGLDDLDSLVGTLMSQLSAEPPDWLSGIGGSTDASTLAAVAIFEEEKKKKSSSKKSSSNETIKKPVVACDLDEVLGGFLPCLTEWHNKMYATTFTLADYKSYEYADLWGGTNAESVAKVHEFFHSSEFQNGVQPIAHAFETLQKFTNDFDFIVVTSRQTVIEKETKNWIEQHYPNIFSSIKLGNHYDLASPDPDAPSSGNIIKRSKPDMCKDIQATALIDDSAKYAYQCASEVKDGATCTEMRLVVLFGEYGWNTGSHVPNVDQVSAFEEQGIVARAANWEPEVRLLLEKHRESLRE